MEQHLSLLAEQLSASLIITPLRDLVCVAPTDTIEIARERMADLYEQLPVTNGEVIVGMIFRSDLSTAEPAQQVSGHLRGMPALASLRTTDHLRTVLDCLVENECALVFAPDSGTFCGLVHYSDLNRHAMRVFFYLWLSALEMQLAEYIRRRYPNYDDWLKGLDEYRQVSVLGRHEIARRQNLILNPIEWIEFSDLVRIAGNLSPLLNSLSYSKNHFKEVAGALVDLRNAAMHPVRSFVRSHAEVRKLKNRLTDLMDLVRRLHRVLQENPTTAQGPC